MVGRDRWEENHRRARARGSIRGIARELALDQLERGGGPILVRRRRTLAAALVSLKDYRERFLGREAEDRQADVAAILKRLKPANFAGSEHVAPGRP